MDFTNQWLRTRELTSHRFTDASTEWLGIAGKYYASLQLSQNCFLFHWRFFLAYFFRVIKANTCNVGSISFTWRSKMKCACSIILAAGCRRTRWGQQLLCITSIHKIYGHNLEGRSIQRSGLLLCLSFEFRKGLCCYTLCIRYRSLKYWGCTTHVHRAHSQWWYFMS